MYFIHCTRELFMYHMESWLMQKLWGNYLPLCFPTLFGDLIVTHTRQFQIRLWKLLPFSLVLFCFLPCVTSNEELQWGMGGGTRWISSFLWAVDELRIYNVLKKSARILNTATENFTNSLKEAICEMGNKVQSVTVCRFGMVVKWREKFLQWGS